MIEKYALVPYNHGLACLLISGLADMWAACVFIDYSKILKEYQESFEFIQMVCLLAFAYRTVCHVILLKQGLLRIIDLDVEDYKAKGR